MLLSLEMQYYKRRRSS